MSIEIVQNVIQQIATLSPTERQTIKAFLDEQEKKDTEVGNQKSEPPVTCDPMRRQEYQWIREHRDEYSGQYVVVEGDQLVAHGKDGRQVLAAARQAGIRIPFIVRLEAPDEPPFGGW